MRSPIGYTFRGIEIPSATAEGIERYLVHRVPPGSFLEAVICNDLREACGQADENNAAALQAIVGYFYNEAPSLAWGSSARFETWLNEADADTLRGGA